MMNRAEGDRNWPAVAFAMIEDRRLMSCDAEVFAGAELVQGPDSAQTWQAAENALAQVEGLLKQGRIQARGNSEAERDLMPQQSEGSLILPPNCQYCDYQNLCGRAQALANEA